MLFLKIFLCDNILQFFRFLYIFCRFWRQLLQTLRTRIWSRIHQSLAKHSVNLRVLFIFHCFFPLRIKILVFPLSLIDDWSSDDLRGDRGRRISLGEDFLRIFNICRQSKSFQVKLLSVDYQVVHQDHRVGF